MTADREREEGDQCRTPDCGGTYEFVRDHPCSCHIDPPCQACEEARLICKTCET